jgi:hypothetical protein
MVAKQKQERESLQNARPRNYHEPQLVIYGELKELTAGGSGGKSEVMEKMGMITVDNDPKHQRP